MDSKKEVTVSWILLIPQASLSGTSKTLYTKILSHLIFTSLRL